MTTKSSPHPEWAVKYRRPSIELRCKAEDGDYRDPKATYRKKKNLQLLLHNKNQQLCVL